jgi:hypothetical protein
MLRVPLQLMLPSFRQAKSEPGKDLGRGNSRPSAAAEDAAWRCLQLPGAIGGIA